ncbi:MgtC/SapB family protein [Phyllobacterium lublinensis]|uniref:MgtC/SapB family protein n=1 Tax=Phyllobacterium lublinensis TaxID=2875708 RepID=UPI001CCBA55A|nr:MgtC/SapB family protein [Phyllobacterium sp. 2063]MBZ9655540.1 MgtC/SapB family protein [Phyllobacterium sp. 2063]
MEDLEIFQRMGLAIAIGAAVGVERHWREKDEDDGTRTAGIRTFTLIGMLGGVAGLLEHSIASPGGFSGIVVIGFLITLTFVFTLFQLREAIAEQNYSVTSVVAAMLTFSFAVIAVLGDMTVASAGGVILVAVLASREFLHAAMRKLRWTELRSAVILLALTFVILPIVPSEPIGPFGGISPSRILTMVISLAAISFCGYAAVRVLGSAKGEIVGGAVGGLISSTATTVSNARRSTTEDLARPLAAGAISAGGISMLRTLLLVVMLGRPLSMLLLPVLVAGAATMLGYAFLIARRSTAEHPELSVKNPFDLAEVIKMALLLVGVGFVVRVASQFFGDEGLLIASALSGLADVDAATVTVTGMLQTLSAPTASLAIALAVLSNTLAKAVYASALGTVRFSAHVWIASLLSMAAAGVCWTLVQLADGDGSL